MKVNSFEENQREALDIWRKRSIDSMAAMVSCICFSAQPEQPYSLSARQREWQLQSAKVEAHLTALQERETNIAGAERAK